MAHNLLNEDKGYGKIISFKAHKDLDRGALLEIVKMSESRITAPGILDLELYEVKDASATTKKEDLLVNISVAKMYDERLMEEDYFTEKDSTGRGRLPEQMCTHTYPLTMFEGVVAVGDKLKLGASAKLTKATGTDVAIAVVKEKYNFNGQDSVKVRYL